jgi:protein-S-isoprenylcysteine O-methyltransferase Ste14
MNINRRLLVGQIIFLFMVFALALFLPAGTIVWPAAWVFLVLFFGFVVALTLWLFRHNPALLTERMRGNIQSGQKAWDKLFQILVNIAFFVWLIVMPLDAMRFHWSQVPFWLQLVGAVMLLYSFYLFFLTFRENSYLSPVVRIQKERGQSVVSTGPYHYVRHPMYAGAALFLLGTPLLLGSLYGILIGLLLVVMIAIRAVMEERMLREELSGYDAYMHEVKYRLIPYVW